MRMRLSAALLSAVLGATLLGAAPVAADTDGTPPGDQPREAATIGERTGQATAKATPRVTVPGSFTGLAFDSCSAPSQQQMDRWHTTSPYAGVGVYIGGVHRRCDQSELDAAWVRRQTRTGWHVLPLFVGLQASCSGYEHRMSDDRDTAYAQGRRAATSAVGDARRLGIGAGSTLFYDLEDYDISGDDCRRAALSFLSGWTRRLRQLHYDSGVYSNVAAAITSLDFAARVDPGAYAMPDDIWFAWSNGRQDTDAGQWVTSDQWDGHTRIHQYAIDVQRSHGGQRLHVDLNVMDVGGGSVARRARPTCGVEVDSSRYPVRRRGSRGAAVSAAQCLLKQQGHGRAGVTGRFDRATVQAVRAAQRRHDLPVNGVVTRRTWTVLLAAGPRPVLKLGSTGEPVRHLQRALTATLGGWVPVTGVVNQRTVAAVRDFQRRAGLPRHGVVDTQTWKRLQAGG